MNQIPTERRPDRSTYFMLLAVAAATRSTCLSKRVACVVVRDQHVIATGYNGTPSGIWHPQDFPTACPCQGGRSGVDNSLKYCSHAEANALIQCARRGTSTEGAEIYSLYMPCFECTKLLLTAGVAYIHFLFDYPDPSGQRELYLQQTNVGIKRVAVADVLAQLDLVQEVMRVPDLARTILAEAGEERH
ncbi:MAG: deoxycytidylate deaminase [Candidatus Dormibacteria bacterium]